ncbi:FkbM family methyltransferase [Terrarubrum flagellatum]|uniref:FkbM family methyltransferase n=1 Tax=Terrirubrum flagellatum TaxID=2895980 RepID=UPI003144F420
MRITTADELMTAAPATHFIKSWSGIIDPKDAAGVTKNSVWAQLNQNEPHEPHFRIFAGLTGGQLFMDVGANCGQSIISFKSVNPEAQIRSFEPATFSFAIASRVARVFQEAQVFNFGLSDRTTRLPIFTPVIDGLLVTPLSALDPSAFEPNGTMHRFLMEDIAKGADVSLFSQEIELRRGDEFALSPDVIKIDVEGAELQVLAGLEETIGAHRPLIMTEKSDAVGIARFLADFDYEPYRYDEKLVDRPALKHLPVVEGMNPDHLPLNVFYICRDKLALYRGEFGMQIEGPAGH